MSKRETYETRTEELITPILDRMNFELVDVEYVKEGGTWYLRAYIDKEGGITVNDCEAVARAGEGGHKEINRTNLTKVQIAEALEKPVVKKQLELLRLRRNCPAFAQGAKVQIESCGPELTIEWSCSGHVARLQANLQKLTYRVEIE